MTQEYVGENNKAGSGNLYESGRKNHLEATIESRESTHPCSSPVVGFRVCSVTGEHAYYRFNDTETIPFTGNSKFWQKESYLSNLGLFGDSWSTQLSQGGSHEN